MKQDKLIGDVGEIKHEGGGPDVDVMIAQDRSRQMAGRIEGKVALDFMNAPYS